MSVYPSCLTFNTLSWYYSGQYLIMHGYLSFYATDQLRMDVYFPDAGERQFPAEYTHARPDFHACAGSLHTAHREKHLYWDG